MELYGQSITRRGKEKKKRKKERSIRPSGPGDPGMFLLVGSFVVRMRCRILTLLEVNSTP